MFYLYTYKYIKSIARHRHNYVDILMDMYTHRYNRYMSVDCNVYSVTISQLLSWEVDSNEFTT